MSVRHEDCDDGLVVSNAQLDCRLLPGELVVAFIKGKDVLRASWLILKISLFLDDEEEAEALGDDAGLAAGSPMRMLVMDGDGCTLCMGRRHLKLLQEAGLSDIVEVAPDSWRAFEFNLGHTVADVPGVVYHLAKLMADDDISVLHMSTYGTEIFLVQEHMLDRAVACIRKKVDSTLNVVLEQRSSSAPAASTDSEGSTSPSSPKHATHAPPTQASAEGAEADGGSGVAAEASEILREKLRSRRWMPPRLSPWAQGGGEEEPAQAGGDGSPQADSLILRVLPDNLLLFRIPKKYLRDCGWILTKLFLFDKTYTSYRQGHLRSSRQNDMEGGERGGVGLLALTEVEGEISLLLDEEASTLFPLEQLAVCPLKWCAIKLCGRKFDFHETGCVCAMSKVDAGVPILNVSTYLTNVTLVERQHLESTLATLSDELEAAIDCDFSRMDG